MRRNQYIGLTVLALAVLLVIYKVRGQSFGSFNHDQPYLVGPNATAATFDPSNVAGIYIRWVQSDITSNDWVTSWKDRYAGNWLVATNNEYRPTNDSYGVWFDNSAMRLSSNNPYFMVSNTMYVIFTFKTNENWNAADNLGINVKNGAIETFIGDQNTAYGGFYFLTNTLAIQTNGPSANVNTGSKRVWFNLPTNQVCTLVCVSNNIYTNGVLAFENISSGPVGFVNVGGWVGNEQVPQNHFYLHELGYYSNNITAIDVSNISYYAQITYSTNKAPEFMPMDISGFRFWWRADKHVYGSIGLASSPVDAAAYWIVDNGSWANNLYGNGSFSAKRRGGTRMDLDFKDNAANGSYNNATAFINDQPNTYFLVFQKTNTLTGTQTPLGGYTQSESVQTTEEAGGSGITLYADNVGAPVTVVPTITNLTILTAYFNGSSSWFRTNKVSAATGLNAGTSRIEAMIIGNRNGLTEGFKGRFTEALVYYGTLSTNDIQRIENWLAAKYGL